MEPICIQVCVRPVYRTGQREVSESNDEPTQHGQTRKEIKHSALMLNRNEHLSVADIRRHLDRVVTQSPIELFDAKPYVDYQRQKYLMAELNYKEQESLRCIKPVGRVGVQRLTKERMAAVKN